MSLNVSYSLIVLQRYIFGLNSPKHTPIFYVKSDLIVENCFFDSLKTTFFEE